MIPGTLMPAGARFSYVKKNVATRLPPPLPQPPESNPYKHMIYSLSHRFTDTTIHQRQMADVIGRK
jgi:hypothetical protein